MGDNSFHEYVYEVENWIDEFVIVVLSMGAIFVTLWSLAFAPKDIGMITFGRIIEPWITMLALMIIARELWIMNMREAKKLEGED